MKGVIIAVDFDGTMVDHRYPDVGTPVPGAILAVRALQAQGAKIILLTMRSGTYLDDAVEYMTAAGITLWGVNENPEQISWTESPKVFAHLYIDDAAVGCPLRPSMRMGGRDMVDWSRVEYKIAAWQKVRMDRKKAEKGR